MSMFSNTAVAAVAQLAMYPDTPATQARRMLLASCSFAANQLQDYRVARMALGITGRLPATCAPVALHHSLGCGFSLRHSLRADTRVFPFCSNATLANFARGSPARLAALGKVKALDKALHLPSFVAPTLAEMASCRARLSTAAVLSGAFILASARSSLTRCFLPRQATSPPSPTCPPHTWRWLRAAARRRRATAPRRGPRCRRVGVWVFTFQSPDASHSRRSAGFQGAHHGRAIGAVGARHHRPPAPLHLGR